MIITIKILLLLCARTRSTIKFFLFFWFETFKWNVPTTAPPYNDYNKHFGWLCGLCIL